MLYLSTPRVEGGAHDTDRIGTLSSLEVASPPCGDVGRNTPKIPSNRIESGGGTMRRTHCV